METNPNYNDALKPCPFCGGAAAITKHFKEGMWWLVHRCPVVGPITIDWTDDASRLIERWNTRVWAGATEMPNSLMDLIEDTDDIPQLECYRTQLLRLAGAAESAGEWREWDRYGDLVELIETRLTRLKMDAQEDESRGGFERHASGRNLSEL